MSDLEKLERLEQSITQLLYEIDSNFSKCHRVITTNILPIVEKYAENSGQVWEHSKFWKQFFEASANVSLSGYEEQANQDGEDYTQDRIDNSDYLDATSAHTTPQQQRPQKGTGESPFDLTGENDDSSMLDPRQTGTPLTQQMDSLDLTSSPADLPTPQAQYQSGNGAAQSPMSTYRKASKSRTTSTPGTAPKNKKNPLLHRVLDSNWKVQATPHSVRSRYTQEEETYLSTSPTDSPPELTTQLGGGSTSSRLKNSQKTPSRGDFAYDSDDDSSMDGMSPPVTLAFSLPPSKLLRTPAKQAAKYMVDELLRTAGANDISTIPNETPRDPLDEKSMRTNVQGQSTFLQGTQNTQNESRRLFAREGGDLADETPIVRKTTGVLDQWHESGEEGTSWL